MADAVRSHKKRKEQSRDRLTEAGTTVVRQTQCKVQDEPQKIPGNNWAEAEFLCGAKRDSKSKVGCLRARLEVDKGWSMFPGKRVSGDVPDCYTKSLFASLNQRYGSATLCGVEGSGISWQV